MDSLKFCIKSFKNFDCSDFHYWHNGKIFTELLNGSDINQNDSIIGYENESTVLYDRKNIINKNKQYSTLFFFENQIHLQNGDKFFIWSPIKDKLSDEIISWLKDNKCEIIYEIFSDYGTLTKCEIKSVKSK
ncbi:MAG: hypothetical protein ACI37Z_09915 [Candidatus Gastranaerophilaceae bacterium]